MEFFGLLFYGGALALQAGRLRPPGVCKVLYPGMKTKESAVGFIPGQRLGCLSLQLLRIRYWKSGNVG